MTFVGIILFIIPYKHTLSINKKPADFMTLKKRITGQFLYINYTRENFKDFNDYKRELENMLSVSVGDRDVVIDFTGSSGVASSEIGLLVRLINKFKGTARFVRVVGNEFVTKMLKSTNIQKLDNFLLYDDQKAFVDQVKKVAGL